MKDNALYDIILIGRQAAGSWQASVHSLFDNAVNLIVNEKRFTLLFNPLWISESNIIISDRSIVSLITSSSRLSSDADFIYIDDIPRAGYKTALEWKMPEIAYSPFSTANLEKLNTFLKQSDANPVLDYIESQFIKTINCFANGGTADFSKIIGAGPGLTPSGDDMLVGFSLALRYCAPELLPLLADYCMPLLNNTTDISKYLLSDALSGNFAFPLINLLIAIKQGENIDRAIAIAADIGSSSGRDGIFGLYQGLKTLENRV